jgi:hypothetical protein
MRENQLDRGLTVPGDRPLIGVPARENGREVVRYYTDDAAADAAQTDDDVRRALAAIGSWSDLDGEETLAALDRIRHESEPSPPLDLER